MTNRGSLALRHYMHYILNDKFRSSLIVIYECVTRPTTFCVSVRYSYSDRITPFKATFSIFSSQTPSAFRRLDWCSWAPSNMRLASSVCDKFSFMQRSCLYHNGQRVGLVFFSLGGIGKPDVLSSEMYITICRARFDQNFQNNVIAGICIV
jgi:hypothetical protein